MSPAKWLALATVLSAAGRLHAGPPPAYTLTDLGIVTITDGGAIDINNAGQVTVNTDGTGYVWQNGTFSPPGGLSNNNTTFAINESGHAAWTQDLRAVYWDGEQTTTLPNLESGSTFAADLNDSNVVVGSSYRPSILRYRAFLWDGVTQHDLGSFTLNGGSSAEAINNAGVVAGTANDLPARWEAGVWTALPLLPGGGYGGTADINESGVIVGHSAPLQNFFATRATMWVNGQAVDLGSVNGREISVAHGVNNLGEVVGSASQYTNSAPFAFVYSGGQMYDLTTRVTAPGWWVQQANAINDIGQIVGTAQFGNNLHAVLLTPVPEPSSASLVLVCGAASAAWTRARQPNRAKARSAS